MGQYTFGQKAWVLFMFFLNGSIGAVTSNIMYNMKTTGLHHILKPFRKPWFQTWLMFLGMALAFFNTPTAADCACPKPKPGKGIKGWPLFRVISIPSLCDMIATVLQNIGLLYLPPSVWQMTRGSILLFTALFAIFYRKKKLHAIDWVGVCTTILGIIVVGISSVLSSGSSDSTSDSTSNSPVYLHIIAMVLVFLAQGLQAYQTILEEELLHDIDATEYEVISYEGLWGIFLCTFIAMPIANIVPESWGEGLFESTIETGLMISNSIPIFIAVIIYCATIVFYNIAGMQVTNFSSAIHRNIYEAIRSATVWVVSVIVHYIAPNSGAGESLSLMSLVQLLGFSISILGSFIYNRVIKLPFFDYSPVNTNSEPLNPKEECEKKH